MVMYDGPAQSKALGSEERNLMGIGSMGNAAEERS
jgi:hypothetical protein